MTILVHDPSYALEPFTSKRFVEIYTHAIFRVMAILVHDPSYAPHPAFMSLISDPYKMKKDYPNKKILYETKDTFPFRL